MPSIGNKVKFINEALTGVITKIISTTEVEIEDNYGFLQIVKLSEIVEINSNETISYAIDEKDISATILPKQKQVASSFLDRYKKNSKFKYGKIIEVDLHLEELVEFPTRLEDWQKLHTQINHVKKCIAAAQQEKISRIIFIHGKGTGVLKTELRNLLSNHYQLNYADANYSEYDTGATEVYL